MEVQVRSFDELNDLGQEIVQLIDDNSAAIERINDQLEDCQTQWEALVKRMEEHSSRVTSVILFVDAHGVGPCVFSRLGTH